MVEAVSLGQVGLFVQQLIYAYDSYIYLGAVMMFSFAIIYFVKDLVTGRR